MGKYWDITINSFSGYWNYLAQEITNPSIHNYFYLLIAISSFVWILEILLPWRKTQSIIRKDFWLDGFYMFFNFFLFSLIGYNALSNIGVNLFNDFLSLFGVKNTIAIEISKWHKWLQLITLFVIKDFIHWNIHRLLHHVSWLWQFHKLHHSVKEMGFAAHLRYHWMETIIYNSLQYIPLAMIGYSIHDFFVVHAFTILIGHLNHANLNWNYGIFRYVLNNPPMHLWHHAKALPNKHPNGVNFGITLSIWDYLFGTAYTQKKGGEIELGFQDEKSYPKRFIQQVLFPFYKGDKRS